MQTMTFQIDSGRPVKVSVQGRKRAHVLLNKEDTGIFFSHKTYIDRAPALKESAYVRSDETPVRFIVDGSFTLWASTKDPYHASVGVSVILEEVVR